MADEFEQNNFLSQEEIDRLSSDSNDDASNQDSQISEEDESISNLLSQDEIEQLAKNSTENPSMTTDPTASIDPSPAEMQTEENIGGMEDPPSEIQLDHEAEPEPEPEAVAAENSLNPQQEPEDSETESSPSVEEMIRSEKSGIPFYKKKFIILPAAALFVIVAAILVLNPFSSSSEQLKPEKKPVITTKKTSTLPIEAKKEKPVPISQKTTAVKKEKTAASEPNKRQQEIVTGSMSAFFEVFDTQGIEGAASRSEDRFVEYEMDISEENLFKCFVFDLSASLFDIAVSKQKKSQTHPYFSPEALEKRFMIRLTNLGYEEDEARSLFLRWGSAVIEELKLKYKEKLKKAEND